MSFTQLAEKLKTAREMATPAEWTAHEGFHDVYTGVTEQSRGGITYKGFKVCTCREWDANDDDASWDRDQANAKYIAISANHILQLIEAAMVMREALDKSKILRNKSLLDVNPTNVLREIRRIFEMQDEALAKADEICGTK